MPNLTVNLKHLGVGAKVTVLKAWVEASSPSWAQDGTTIALPDAPLKFTDGVAVADLLVPPAPIRYQVVVRYIRPGDTETSMYESGWFAFTGPANLASLATVPIAPEAWGDGFRAELEGIRDEVAALVEPLTAPANEQVASYLTTPGPSLVALNASMAAAVRDVTPSFAPLKRRLSEAAQRPVAVQVLGDSTGNDPTEWPTLTIQHLAALYPAWTVQTRLWSDATQQYGAPVTIQTGTAGVQYLSVATGNTSWRVPHAAVTHITGTMDVRVKLAADDWSPASGSGVTIGRENGAGQRSWWTGLSAGGAPFIVVSSDGTALTTINATAPVALADGATSWLRVVYTPDDGAGNRVTKFYLSTDGVTWTQHGTTVTTAGAIQPFEPTNAPIDLGGRGGAAGLTGKYYEVQVLAGENGPNTVPQLPGLWSVNTSAGTPATLVGAPVLTLVNGSHPGAALAYLNDATRRPKMLPQFGQEVTFLSESHNEAGTVDAAFLTAYNAWAAAVQARLFGVPLVLVTQNPQNGSATAAAHAARRGNLMRYAASQRLDLLDTFKAFLDDPRGLPALMADPIHPNSEGSKVWASVVTTAYDLA